MKSSDFQKLSSSKMPPGIEVDSFIRSRRRTIGLQIASDGRLIVRAPLRAPLKDIQSFILKKQNWILNTQAKVRSRARLAMKRQYLDGEMFPFLGRDYELRLVSNGSKELFFDNVFCLQSKYQERASEIFRKWYRAQALEIISRRVEVYSAKYGLRFRQVRISNARRRWGSCSAQGNLNFSWRLAMAPMEAVDYVVIHELAHLIERNHSIRFWNKVKEMMPDYRIYRKWLRENEKKLDL